MKKTYFNGKQVYPVNPAVKKNQIWERVESGELLKVIKVERKAPSYYLENENGKTFHVGGAWLNGYDYKFVGMMF